MTALLVTLLLAGSVALPLGSALGWAIAHSDRTPITWCTSCVARPATHTETIGGARFAVCQSCRNGGRS